MPASSSRTPRLTLERLKEVLDYDPVTGIFTWKAKTAKGTKIGSVAGSTDPNGYRYIRIDKEDHLAQRLAWFYVKGVWPKLIRFQDKDTLNCAIDNLEEGFYLNRRMDKHDPVSVSAYNKEYKSARADIIRSQRLQKEFGIDLAEYNRKHEEQGGVCVICQKPETEMRDGKVKWMAVDHNHTTGAVRDLLCTSCNKMIGLACESIDVLKRAVEYLERHERAEAVVAASEVTSASLMRE